MLTVKWEAYPCLGAGGANEDNAKATKTEGEREREKGGLAKEKDVQVRRLSSPEHLISERGFNSHFSSHTPYQRHILARRTRTSKPSPPGAFEILRCQHRSTEILVWHSISRYDMPSIEIHGDNRKSLQIKRREHQDSQILTSPTFIDA